MGGRGSASGLSKNPYGSEYHTVFQLGNVKFVQKNEGSATAPLETQTSGRVYALVTESGKLKTITYYDKHGKRYKQIDLDHYHKIDGEAVRQHTHFGYNHAEKGTKPTSYSKKESAMVERVEKAWYNYKRSNGI